MLITHLVLKNWRNFRSLDVPLRELSFLLGPNASGKSNILDVFRFLRDVSKTQGGGLQKAVADRGGITKLRCLHARKDPGVQIEVSLSEVAGEPPLWTYVLGFEGKGAQRILISKEQVWQGKDLVLDRPTKQDKSDPLLLTQTHLEQIQMNGRFRDLVEFFGATTYLHLVPQLLKFAEKIGGQRLEDDPFGQGFLERLAKTPEKTRDSRLRKIETALAMAVPQFKQLEFKPDALGHPHLRARYKHHRPNAGWQSEEHFSDGTLRLVGLLWALQEGTSLLLLEEPEIFLNESIVRQIPLMLSRVQRNKKVKRQIILSTHSEALLSNPGIDGRGVILLETSAEGSSARTVNEDESEDIKSGLSVAEVVLPKAHPSTVNQLGLWQ